MSCGQNLGDKGVAGFALAPLSAASALAMIGFFVFVRKVRCHKGGLWKSPVRRLPLLPTVAKNGREERGAVLPYRMDSEWKRFRCPSGTLAMTCAKDTRQWNWRAIVSGPSGTFGDPRVIWQTRPDRKAATSLWARSAALRRAAPLSATTDGAPFSRPETR